ncbi:S-adenosylmethionine-dependent methyltransferase [Neophaeococcomyces mojaviensis]|uniref:S-adenosylmethionine-dependent methyltransferase n=1 Tax=Neophaeococcomyces mojaviensis TaxID=3383035 RepID=A0ACC3A9D0_9EURO|nr:S-adenosylmethionine-dependent methyltransferase [Knufia sp. JES_112]
MLPTPDTSHVSFNTIYEPAEDSFLLLDSLSSPSEAEWLHQRFSNHSPLAIEVGTGSGVVIGFLSANAEYIFGKPITSLGIDVNTNACKATRETARKAIKEQNSSSDYLASACGDLCSAIKPQSVDVLVFNPPYVPTEELPALPNIEQNYRDEFEKDSHLLSLSYAGGLDGMETTYRLLQQIPDVLSGIGVAYVLLCAQNKPEQVKTAVGGLPNGPWLVETIGRSGKKAGWEKLQIIRIWREPN